ncbi:hypothetical protein GCM10007860_12600 [Chitiniphilus shinanonensis]|uniref:GAF domain-containing protein n=1 Tax=Chitiniphilus shinanonensis TaxID=553088 RepID=A0ABQ6BRK0_9NEIS|nr:GAF domain-containing protein [Chitiniphilus shinanonensis]GLS04114.1 hypothetical protein GCM10007860_12600 [Chitiniphilus shinanonensis]
MATLNPTHDPAAALAYWRARPLPLMQATREKLLPFARRGERANPADVADIVLQDPLLAVKVLRAANQRIRSSLASDVVALESVVLLYGVAPFVEQFVRGPTVEELLDKDPRRLQRFRAETLNVRFATTLTRDYAARRHDARPDEVTAAALLSGMPALLAILAEVDSDPPPGPMPFERLLAAWQTPDAVIALCRERGEATPRQTMQHATQRLAGAVRQGWWQDDVTHALKAIAQVLLQPDAVVWRVLVSRMLEFARQENWRDIDWPPARWLAMLPGDWPLPPPPKPAAPPRPDPLAQRMQALHLAGKQGAAANHIVSLAVHALAEGMQMRRIALILISQDGKSLRVRFTLGVADDDPLQRFALGLEAPTLFAQLMQKPQCVWLQGERRESWAALLPAALTEQIGPDDFCAMSLFVHDKPLGMLFADRGDDAPLSEADYQSLRRICQLTCKALAESAPR